MSEQFLWGFGIGSLLVHGAWLVVIRWINPSAGRSKRDDR